MALKVTARLQGYQVQQIKDMIDAGAMGPAARLTAIQLARVARNRFRSMSKNSGSGSLLRDIKAMPGKFDGTTWLYGVFGSGSGRWTDTTGGRGHFFEYGRSAPGKGKGSGGPQSKGARPQPPRPFMRPTIAQGKRLFQGMAGKEVSAICRKIRSGRIPNTLIKDIK